MRLLLRLNFCHERRFSHLFKRAGVLAEQQSIATDQCFFDTSGDQLLLCAWKYTNRIFEPCLLARPNCLDSLRRRYTNTTTMEGFQPLPFAAAVAPSQPTTQHYLPQHHPVERRCAIYNSVFMLQAAALVCSGEPDAGGEESSTRPNNKRSSGTTSNSRS
jgi:hypothetical protein